MNISHLFLRLREKLSPFRYKAEKCGHYTKRVGSVSAFGLTVITKMPKNHNGSVDYCLNCIGKMAIRCAWCGDPIFIGDPITLYTPYDGFQVPDHAVIHKKEPLKLVGCLGWDCADTISDQAGIWTPVQSV